MSQAYRHRRNKKYKNHEPYKPWELLLLILIHTVPSLLIILLGTYIVKTQYFLGGSKSGASVEIHGRSAIFFGVGLIIAGIAMFLHIFDLHDDNKFIKVLIKIFMVAAVISAVLSLLPH